MPDLLHSATADETDQMLGEAELRRILNKTNWWLGFALGVPLLVLVALVVLLLRSARWVDHTDQVIARANLIENALVTMQSSFRGYRLSGLPEFLVPLREKKMLMDSELSGLSEMVADSPAQFATTAQIREATETWLKFVDSELVSLEKDLTQLRNPEFLKRGVPLFAQCTGLIDKFISTETGLRVMRARDLNALVIAVFILFAVAAVAGIPLLTSAVRRHLRQVSDSHKASRAEAELRANELHVTLSSIGDAVVAVDAQGRIEFLNPVAESMMGWTNAEARGKGILEVFDIINEHTQLPAENPVERVLKENKIVGLANHTLLRSRNGLVIPIEDSAAPIRNQDGEVLGVVLVFHDVTEKHFAKKRLLESEKRLRFLNLLSDVTRPLSAPEQILAKTTRVLGEHLKVTRCAYADVDEDGDHFTIQQDYVLGCKSIVGSFELSLFGEEAMQRMHAGKLLILNDVNAELEQQHGRDTFNAIDIKAIICCPLIKEGRLRAMMAVHQMEPRQWTEDEISLVSEVVERSWANIERARTELELNERAKLSALRADIAAALDKGSTTQQTLQHCCELLVAHLEAAFARIWTLDESGQMLILEASAGLSTDLHGVQSRVPVGQLKIGRIAQSQQPFLTNDVEHDPNISDHEWAHREGLKAFAGYPLHVEGRLAGVLGAFSRKTMSGTVLGDLAPICDAIAQHLERKRTEAALAESEVLKSAIINTSLDGFVLLNHEGRITDWNAAAETIFQIPREEAVGTHLGSMIVSEELRGAHDQGLAKYLGAKDSRILGKRIEISALKKGGEEFPCELSVTQIPDTEPPLFAGYVRDITQRKQAEVALRKVTELAESNALASAESAERFRLLAEVVSIQVWTSTLEGQLDYANQECLEYFGIAEERSILGNEWTKYVHPDDIAAAGRRWQHALTTGERYEAEFRLLRHDGEYRWFLARAEAMTDNDSKMVKWFGTNTDIHELKVAQGNAEMASRKKDAFLAALSHELRTPLTPVLMTAASLREDERLPADVREDLGMIERNIALEARLIDDLLDLTSIARGKLTLRSQLCDTHSLIDLAIEIVRDDAQAKNIALSKQYSAKNCGLVVDPARFQQVIWNLLRNAVKFTPRNGRIHIQTHDESSDGLRISVEDSGIGIEFSELTQIFLPFEQGGLTGDHRFGGMGLGLSIARAIVEMHGGSINAHSVGANQGSTFTVVLPNATKPPHGVATGKQNASENSAQDASPGVPPVVKARLLELLLVEDHEPTLQVLSRLLQRVGHKVVTAGTIGDALRIAATQTFDLVISDLGLPDGSGIELMAELRDVYKLQGIALSGYGMEEDLARSRRAGFVAHLIKPIDFAQLKRALAHWDLERGMQKEH